MNRTTDVREHANGIAPAPAQTFMGSIRWIAVAIGLACLALLSMIAGMAHAEGAPGARAATHAAQAAPEHDAMPSADVPSRPAWRSRTDRRKPSDR